MSKQREYAFFLSFSSFIGTFFFLGVYFDLYRTIWLSILIGAVLVWVFLHLLIRSDVAFPNHPLVLRFLAMISIAYGGFSLYAFFAFCQEAVFPGNSFLFFPICFLTFTMFGAENQIHTLERTSKFTSAVVTLFLVLVIISMTQKLWDEKEYVADTWQALFVFHESDFGVQTVIVSLILLSQALVLLTVLEVPEDSVPFLRSISRALIPASLFSALLHLISVLSLGAFSFEFLTYPIYDMLSLPGYAEYLDRTELLMLIIALFCESVKTIAFFRAGRRLFTAPAKRLPKKEKIHTA